MTVEVLVDKLKAFPMDAEVTITSVDSEGYGNDVDITRVEWRYNKHSRWVDISNE